MFQISLFSTLFFERTAQNSASFSWYSRKIQRLQPWEIIGRKKKRNKKEKSLSWKGTSTWGTPQLNSLGWIGTTTQGTPHLNSQREHFVTTSQQTSPAHWGHNVTWFAVTFFLHLGPAFHSRLRRRRHVAAWMMRSELRSGSRAQQ